MHRRLWLLLISLVTLAFLLGACSNGDNNDASDTSSAKNDSVTEVQNVTIASPDTTQSQVSEDLESQPETTAGNSEYVDDATIEADLYEMEANSLYLTEELVYFNFDSWEITERNSNEEYDEIYISAKLSNSYYTVNVDYILCYLYEDGDWTLDYFNIIEYQTYAIANPASDDNVIAFLENHFSSCSITGHTQYTDPSGIFYDTVDFTASLDYNYLSVKFSGWLEMSYYDDAWHETWDFWVDHYDWSAFEDTFQYREQSLNMGAGFYSADVQLTFSNIEQISDTKLNLTYSGSVYLYDKTGKYVDTNEKIDPKTVTLSIFKERITIMGKEIVVPVHAHYIHLPWYGTFAVKLQRDAGVGATDDTDYGSIFAPFHRYVSDEEVQDAIDKLHQLNP